MKKMIALACDHGGYGLMQDVKAFLDESGYGYMDFGTYSEESCDYPGQAIPAALAVASKECDRGIFICTTGIGMSITANKVPGIRAALCTNKLMAEMTRRHNDANVLTLGAKITDKELSLEIVRIFLTTGFDAGKHLLRVNMISDFESAGG